jgi:endonuclease/exonuclease/phosphatase family metal-dependent hydrolase
MAEHTTHSLSLSTTSHDTALCVILPNTLCGNINQLRELYDKAYELWPPHINLIYPFVAPESLPRAQEQIQAHFKNLLDLSKPKTVGLDEAGLFSNRKTDTIFLRESQDPSTSYLVTLRSLALQALGQSPSGCNLHLTIGQPEDKTLSARDFLLAKAELLPRLDFQVGALAILIRERMAGPESPCRMRLWGTIEVTDSKDAWRPVTPEYWTCQTVPSVSDIPLEESHEDDGHRESRAVVREGSTYYYNSQLDKWAICSEVEQNNEDATTVTVASYNVLIDSEYPPARDRETLLLRTMLSDSAMADILVLQEVSDDFLSYLLNDAEIQRRYPYTSHAPPSQVDVGPLPSLRNIVVLSRWAFNWRFVPFHRRHKGAVVALFGLNPSSETSEEQNLVIAGVHLTAGLTDGSVAAKRTELQRLTRYLKQNYNTEPWVVAGDFNITTSTYTIDTALKDKSITSHTKATLAAMEASISDAGLFDAWSAARVEAADDMGADNVGELFEGEDGATFDPRNNALAAGTTGTSHNRPQRYDRILVHPRKTFRIAHFNHFGQPQDIDGVHVVASDHNGIRASLEVLGKPDLPSGSHDPLLDLPFEHKRAIHNLSSTSDLKLVLEKHHMFPTNDEIQRWQHAFSVLKQAVLGVMDNAVSASSDIPLVLVPVGSYALGVWTSTSDVDCLCIGTISSKTFFKLVRQRLMRAENQGIRILRRVEANSGTMLELSVHGIDFDLQYCPAARVVERLVQIYVQQDNC